MSDHRSLSEFLDELQPRLNRTGRPAATELLEETVEELRVAVEELRVAEEEIADAAVGAETRRLASEREATRFRDAFHTLPAAMLLTDGAGRVAHANTRAGELLGVSAADLEGRPLAVFVGDDERRAFRKLLLQVPHGDGPHTLALTLRPRGRLPVDAEATVWPVAVADGPLLGWRLDDVTRRRAGDETHGDDLAVLRGTLDALPVAVAAMDLDGSVLLWNRAARRLLGWSEEEVVGRSNPALPDELMPVLDSVRAAGTDPALTLGVTAAAERKDGGPARVDLSLGALIGADGVVRGTVAVIRPAGGAGAAAVEAEGEAVEEDPGPRPRWPAAELRRVLFAETAAGDVSDRLRTGIAAALDLGYLRPGDRLPGTREAATVSGIDHRVISAAYRRLAAEGLVEVRPRRGPVVAALAPADAEPLGETPEWLAGVLEGAAQLQVRLPSLSDLVRRWTQSVAVRCLCVDGTEDGRVALMHEMTAQWGMECTPAAPEERGSQRELAVAIRASDLVVTTHFSAGAVRALARSAGKPVVVAAARADLVEAMEDALRRGPLTAVVADAAFAERLRVVPHGDRLRVVVAGDAEQVEALGPEETVLLTLAAQQKVRRPLRLLAAPGHFIAPLDARALARVLIRANLSSRARAQD